MRGIWQIRTAVLHRKLRTGVLACVLVAMAWPAWSQGTTPGAEFANLELPTRKLSLFLSIRKPTFVTATGWLKGPPEAVAAEAFGAAFVDIMQAREPACVFQPTPQNSALFSGVLNANRLSDVLAGDIENAARRSIESAGGIALSDARAAKSDAPSAPARMADVYELDQLLAATASAAFAIGLNVRSAGLNSANIDLVVIPKATDGGRTCAPAKRTVTVRYAPEVEAPVAPAPSVAVVQVSTKEQIATSFQGFAQWVGTNQWLTWALLLVLGSGYLFYVLVQSHQKRLIRRSVAHNAIEKSNGRLTMGGERSVPSAKKAALHFQNKLNVVVQVSWVSYSGAFAHHFDILPGDIAKQETFVGHTWLISDELGNEFVRVMPVETGSADVRIEWVA